MGITGGVTRAAEAADSLKKYQRKRELIRVIESLDCVKDAELIEAIARDVQFRAGRVKVVS